MSYQNDDDNEYNPEDLNDQLKVVERIDNSDYDEFKEKKSKKRLKKQIKREDYDDYDEPNDIIDNDEEDFKADQDSDNYSEDFDESPKKHKKLQKKDKKSKKKKKDKKMNFFEDEAEDTDEVDESVDGEIPETQFKKIRQELDKGHKSKKENIAERLENKYANIDENDIAHDYEDDLAEERYADEINDKQPKLTDPKLWLVKCKMGKEKESVNDLLHKYFFNNKVSNLKIFSALAIDALKGYIYIEAFKEANVREAIAGMGSLRENSIKIVPPNEMVQVFNFDKLEKVDLKVGQWVRMKTGLYENDLAQIVGIEDTANKIYIKIIPRIFETTGKDKNIGDYSKQIKNNLKPKQQFFNPHIHGTKEEKRHNFLQENLYYWRNKFFKDGFMIKCVKLKSLNFENIIPKIDELRIFESAVNEQSKEEGNNIFDSIINLNDNHFNKRSQYLKGDKVKLTMGNLNGLTGTVISHNSNAVRIIPDIQGFSEELEIPENYLMKHFLPGDMVTVEKGSTHIGKTGLVVKIEDGIALIFSDSTNTEFKVSVSDLVHSSRAGKDKAENCSLELEDLVKINGSNQYSFILSIQGHSLKLLDLNNNIKSLSTRDVTKITSK